MPTWPQHPPQQLALMRQLGNQSKRVVQRAQIRVMAAMQVQGP
jgi:hypothetical protein